MSFAFGKHKGRSFETVAVDDPGYCQWALRMENPSGALRDFVEFLKERGGLSDTPSRIPAPGTKVDAATSSSVASMSIAGGGIQFVCELMRNEEFCVRAERPHQGASLPSHTWSAVGALRGARPAGDRKKWVFPLRDHDSVVASLSQLGSVEPIPPWVFDILKRIPTSHAKPKEEYLPEKLLPYQLEGVRFGLSRSGRCLIGDEMGLGKTLQGLALATQYMQDWPVLVVCPSSVRWVWKDQVEEWLPNVVCQGEVQVIKRGADNFNLSAKFWIISYSLLAADTKKGKFQQRPDGSPHQFVIADESHNIKEWSSARTKAIVPILRKATRAILLSGTPTRNSPVELHPQLCSLLPSLPAKFADFKARYCVQQVQQIPGGRTVNRVAGARNTAELNHLLEATVMVRRLKKEVLAQLPEKRRQRIPLEVADTRALKDVRSHQKQPGGAMFIDGDGDVVSSMFKSLAQAKIPAVKEYISEVLERGDEKAIIFGHHQVLLDAVDELLRSHLAKDGLTHMRIDGKTPVGRRHALVQQFQEDAACRIALLSITACGEGLTLTAAGLVIFAELYWVPGAVEQAEARAHRIGTSHAKVMVEFLVVPNSPDEEIFKSLQRKKEDTSSVLDGAAETLAAQCTPVMRLKNRGFSEGRRTGNADGSHVSQGAKRLFAALASKASEEKFEGAVAGTGPAAVAEEAVGRSAFGRPAAALCAVGSPPNGMLTPGASTAAPGARRAARAGDAPLLPAPDAATTGSTQQPGVQCPRSAAASDENGGDRPMEQTPASLSTPSPGAKRAAGAADVLLEPVPDNFTPSKGTKRPADAIDVLPQCDGRASKGAKRLLAALTAKRGDAADLAAPAERRQYQKKPVDRAKINFLLRAASAEH